MRTITRAVLAAALVTSVTAGAALPATAATAGSSHSAHVRSEARTARPRPQVDRTVSTQSSRFTVTVSQRTVCAGTAKCVFFSGTAIPGQTVVVRYDLVPGAKRHDLFTSGPATAVIATADAHGRWSGTADIYSPQITADPRSETGKSVKYRVIMSDDLVGLSKTGQYQGYIPVR